MKKLQIDILGNAPSIVDIKAYNKPYLNIIEFFDKLLSWLFVVTVILLVLDEFFFPQNSISDIGLFIGYVFCGLYMLFLYVGVIVFSKIEKYISCNEVIGLDELCARHSEIALYHNQVITSKRDLLKSEYSAYIKFDVNNF